MSLVQASGRLPIRGVVSFEGVGVVHFVVYPKIKLFAIFSPLINSFKLCGFAA